MKNIERHLIFLLFMCCLSSCLHDPRPDYDALMRNAELSINTNPEAALHSLDSISSPKHNLSESDYMNYALLHAAAAFLSDKEFKNDTAIFEACRYYEKKDDFQRLAKAMLFSACVLDGQDQTDAAVETYNKAFAIASKNADSAVMARAKHYLGNLNYNSGYYDNALQNFFEANLLYGRNFQKKAIVHNSIGSIFLLKHEIDSALHYLEKGSVMASEAQDNGLYDNIMHTMSIVYKEKGDFEQSLLFLKQSVRESMDYNDSVRYHLNFAILFLSMDDMDSTARYAHLLQKEVKNVSDSPEQTAIYDFLAQYEAYIGNADSSFYFEQQKFDVLSQEYNKRLQQSVYEAQQKFDFEAQQNQYNSQLANRRRTILLLVIGLLVMTMIVAVAMYRNAQKNKALADVFKDLLTFKQENSQMQTNFTEREKDLSNQLASYENRLERELKFRQIVMQQTDLLTKSKGDRLYMLDLEKTVFGGSNHWDKMMTVFDELYPGVRASMHEHYPQLSELEVNDFVLSIIGVTRNDEALLLDVSVSVVDKMRAKVKKITKKP